MLKITYRVYEPSLSKTFTLTRSFRTMEDFRLYAFSLYSGNWTMLNVESN